MWLGTVHIRLLRASTCDPVPCRPLLRVCLIHCGSGPPPLCTGGRASTLLSPAGDVIARADMVLFEMVVPVASPSSGSGTSSGGTAGASGSSSSTASGVITRVRALLTLSKPAAAAVVSGGADEDGGGGGGGGSAAGGVNPTAAVASLAATVTKLSRPGTAYPGKSFHSFIAGWKEQLAENSRRRRRLVEGSVAGSDFSRRSLESVQISNYLFDESRSTTVLDYELSARMYLRYNVTSGRPDVPFATAFDVSSCFFAALLRLIATFSDLLALTHSTSPTSVTCRHSLTQPP